MFKKFRFMLFFMFVTIKTTLEMFITKTRLKDLRKIRFMTILAFILITTVSTFKVSIIKTTFEKYFN